MTGSPVVNEPPQRVLAGRRTQIYSPWEVSVRRGRTYVKSSGRSADGTRSARDRILVFGKGAGGGARPERVLKGPKVGSWRARGITVDRQGRIITTTTLPGPGGEPQDLIAVFGRRARGNVAPVRTITDGYFLPVVEDAGFGGPFFSGPLAVTRDGTIYASTDAPGTAYDGIAVFAPGASGAPAPIRWIRGPHTGLRNPTSIKLDRTGNIWVTSAGVLLRFPAGSDADTAPDRRIELADSTVPAESAGPGRPLLCGVDSSGNVYAVNQPGRSGRTTQVSVFGPDADGSAPALVRLVGPRTKLNASSGCALDAQRRVTVSLHFKSTVQTYAPLVPKR